MSTLPETEFIDTVQALEDFVSDARYASFLAVDTEFIRERTYWPELCLVQIMAGDRLACIDPLQLGENEIKPLRELLLDTGMLKVFHAARQDLEVFHYLWKQVPSPIFDTQVAAAMLGYGDQVGYGGLVKRICGVELAKGHTRTDWRARPLPAEAIEYAADDVRYLVEVYETLHAALTESARLEWLQEEFDLLTDPGLYEPDPATAWKRVKGHNRLSPKQLGVLAALAEWREERALEHDRPRRWILKDQVMIDLARQMPGTVADLEHLRELPERVRQQHGEEIVRRIQAGREQPISTVSRPEPLTGHQEALVDALMALLRARCAEHEMSPAQVATRKQLENLVRGETELPLLKGWRARMAGRDMQAFLNGTLVLGAGDNRLESLPVEQDGEDG